MSKHVWLFECLFVSRSAQLTRGFIHSRVAVIAACRSLVIFVLYTQMDLAVAAVTSSWSARNITEYFITDQQLNCIQMYDAHAIVCSQSTTEISTLLILSMIGLHTLMLWVMWVLRWLCSCLACLSPFEIHIHVNPLSATPTQAQAEQSQSQAENGDGHGPQVFNPPPQVVLAPGEVLVTPNVLASRKYHTSAECRSVKVAHRWVRLGKCGHPECGL